jgi:hypothetical protein
MRSATFVLTSVLSLLATGTNAADPPKKAYLLFPIRTQLQREYFPDPDVRYHMLVHGDSLLDKEGKLDTSGMGFEDPTDAAGLPLRPGDKIRGSVIFAKRPPGATEGSLGRAIVDWAKQTKHVREVPRIVFDDSEWKAAVTFTGDARGVYTDKESEDAVGDDEIRAYPVRTALSCLQSGGADCVVSFRKPYWKDENGTLDEKGRARVKELVGSLKLKERKAIGFVIRGVKDQSVTAWSRFAEKPARELAADMGFKLNGIALVWE